MRFWSTCEISDDVPDMLVSIKEIERHLSDQLANAKFETSFLEWAVIYFCVRPEFADFFSETYIARRKPEKAMEFRLEINHKDFVAASKPEKTALLLGALRRSIDKMQLPKFKVSEKDQAAILKAISDTEEELLN